MNGVLIADLFAAPRSPTQTATPQCDSKELYDLREWGGSSSRLVIDIRNPEHFKALHLSGSVNLPGFSLKHRRDLKESSILLVGEPYQFRTTEQTAKDLIRSGFPAPKILKFGVYSAGLANLSLLSNTPLPPQLEISANILLTELSVGNPLLIVPDKAKFNEAEVKQLGEVRRLKAAEVLERSTLMDRVIVAVSHNERDASAWSEKVLEAAYPKDTLSFNETLHLPIFQIRGGLAELEQSIQQHRAIIAQILKNREPKSCRQ